MNIVDKHALLSKQLVSLIEFVKEHSVNPIDQRGIAERIGIGETTLSREKNWKNAEASLEKCKELIGLIKSAYAIAEDKERGFYFSSLSEDSELAALATKLAINLIDVSTYFEERLQPHKQILARPKEALEYRQGDDRRERFITVTGAGASYAATKGVMPLAAEGARKVRDYIKEKNHFLDDLISQEIKRLSLIYRLDPDDFETVLLACSKYAPNEVLSCLNDLLGLRHLPSLIYDIIAHMFKHRFIDAIINFNFDEILDNAIAEEIGSGEIKMIFSDGDCPNEYNELLTANRLKQPVYIKPHGTISHKGALRFTREAYFDIPVKMKETLYQLIEGKVSPGRQDRLKTNLIVIGFGLQSFEFTETVKEHFSNHPDEEITFWVFDVSRQNIDDFVKDMKGSIKKENIHFFDLTRYSLEEYLKELWNLIETSFEPDYRPKGIENHLLVNHICAFNQGKIEQLNTNAAAKRKYYKTRLYLEIVISLLQSDGILNTKQLVEDRAGKYLNLYRKHPDATYLKDVLKKLELVPYKGIARDTFTLENPALFYADFQQFGKKLYDAMNAALPRSYRPKQGHYASEFESFIRYAEALKRRHLLKITSNFEHPHNHLFSGLGAEHILYTSIAWTYRYRDFLHDPKNDWDLMLAISESGRFLRTRDIEGKRLELILASADLPDIKGLGSLEKGYEHQCLSGKLLYMPWWLHNQHLILCLKRTAQKGKKWDDKWELCGGFYYRSSLLSRRVNPVYISNLDNKTDKKTLLYIFANYWYRAKSYTEQLEKGERKSIPIVQDEVQLNGIIEDLLGLYKAD